MALTTQTARRPFDARLPEGWLMFAACAGLAAIAIQAIHASQWVSRQPDYLPAVLFAAYLGLVFSKFRVVPWPLLHLVAAILGGAVVVWLALTTLDGPMDARVVELTGRMTAWLVVLLTRGSSADPLPFVIAISLLAWATGYTAIWFTFRRRRIWWAILPGAAAIVVNLSYAGETQQLGYLLLFLLVALVAVAQEHLYGLELFWRRHGIPYSGMIRWVAVRDVLAFGTAVLVIAALGPALGAAPVVQNWWTDVSQPWRDTQEDLGKAFMSLTARDTQPANVFFAESMTFRGSFSQPDVVALTVQASAPLYLKGLAYTQYTGQGWLRGEGLQRSQEAGRALPAPIEPLRERLSVPHRVRIAIGKGDLIFAGGQLRSITDVSVNSDVLVSRGPTYSLRSDEPDGGARSIPRELENVGRALAAIGPGAQGHLSPDQRQRIVDLLPPGYQLGEVEAVPSAGDRTAVRLNIQSVNARVEDVVAVRAEGRLRRGQEYTVESTVSGATPDQLRTAGTDYPSWVTGRYLQLPTSLPPRVPALARAVVGSAENPLDKALAIERHLRALRYAEEIPAPPPERDGVDYFLFDVKAGYCDYFASSMAVMLRSVDVPARVVSGYAPGEFDSAQGAWVVREKNAHSWVEVYFPGYGWVEFEPTPSQPERTAAQPVLLPTPVAPPAEPVAAPPARRPEPAPAPTGDDTAPVLDLGDVLAVATPLAGVLLALALGGFLFWNRGLYGLSATDRAYAQMVRLGGWARIPHRPWETPDEYASDLREAIPEAAREVDAITASYVAARYGPPDKRGAVRVVERRWPALRRKLLRAIVRGWTPRWRRRGRP